jgi:glycosyltransferase involved in cell wall biosynthesis
LRRCNGFIVPGKSAREYLESYGIPQETIYTAPNAVDTRFFAERCEIIRKDHSSYQRDLALPNRFFLFVGRMVREKGIFDLLEAYLALPLETRREIGLVFVGDGPARSKLIHRTAGLRDSVVLPGFAQRELLAAYYALADAFVFPTHTDPWGLVVNEAMSCGLPVVCSDAAGCAADLVQDGWNGRLVPVGDRDQLTSSLTELAGDDGLRMQMGRRSRERIARYSPEQCAAGIAGAMIPQEVCAA